MERALCEENYHLYGVEEVERNYIKKQVVVALATKWPKIRGCLLENRNEKGGCWFTGKADGQGGSSKRGQLQ